MLLANKDIIQCGGNGLQAVAEMNACLPPSINVHLCSMGLMNYQVVYDRLISNRQTNKAEGYTEKHHILPRSFGGSNDKSNIVSLKPREHFIAHLLLAKIHGGRMWAALAYMSRGATKSAKGVKVNSRIYDLIKRKDAEWRSEAYSGEGNYWYGKKIPESLRIKMRGPRKSVSGENNPNWGKDRSHLGPVISFVKTYRPGEVCVDHSIADRINRMIGICQTVNRHGSIIDVLRPEIRRLGQYFRGFHLANIAGKIDKSGNKNPNYGNGQAISGHKNPMWCKQHKSSTREKIGEKAKRRMICPHCGKEGNIANMHRWHLDNCKSLNGN